MKYLKIIGISIVILSFLLLGSILIIVNGINAETVKKQAVAWISTQTGQSLQINGKIHWSWFPLHISLDEVELSASEDDIQPFAKIDNVMLSIKWLPLLSRKVEIEKLILYRMNLDIYPDRMQFNKSSFPDKNPISSLKSSTSVAHTLPFTEIEVIDGHIRWWDKNEQQTWDIDNLQWHSKQIQSTNWLAVNTQFQLQANHPRLVDLQVNAKGDMQLDFSNTQYRARNIVLDTQWLNKSFSLLGDVNLNVAKENLIVDKLRVNSDALQVIGNISGKQILHNPSWIGKVEVSLPNLRDWLPARYFLNLKDANSSILRNLDLNTQFQITNNSWLFNSLQARVDDTAIGGNVDCKGLPNFLCHFNLKLSTLNLDNYLPFIEGIENSKEKPESLPTNLLGSSGPSPLAALSPATSRLEGVLAIDQFIFHGINLTQFSAQLVGKPGIMHFSDIKTQLGENKVDGQITLDLRQATPCYLVDMNLSNINLAQLLGSSWIRGSSNLALRGSMAGNTEAALLKTLQGTMKFTTYNGSLQNIDLTHPLKGASRWFSHSKNSSSIKSKDTLFSELTFTAEVNHGLLNSRDLLLKAKNFQAEGKGNINLIDKTLHYRVLVKTTHQSGGANRIGFSVPFLVSGPLSKPILTTDLSAGASVFIQQPFSSKVLKQGWEDLFKQGHSHD